MNVKVKGELIKNKALRTEGNGTKKQGYRWYFPIVFEFDLAGKQTVKPFTRNGVSLGDVVTSHMKVGTSYPASIPTIPGYEYVGYRETIDGAEGTLYVTNDPATKPAPRPQAKNYDGSFDERNISLYYDPIVTAGTIHVRHMVRTSPTAPFNEASSEDISVRKIPDKRTVSPKSGLGTVIGSNLVYSGGFSNTIDYSKKSQVPDLKTPSPKEAWVSIFYENNQPPQPDPSSLTGDFDIWPGPVIKNGEPFTLHPKNFDLKSCTYISHRFMIERDGQNHVEPHVNDMNKDSVYPGMNYPPLIQFDSTHVISMKIYTSCGETDWLAPKSLELKGDPPGPSGPVAVIKGPVKVKAGQPLPFPFDGSSSFDWEGKSIVQYTWDQKLVTKSPTYSPTFDAPGTYTVRLNVKNDWGVLSDTAEHTVEVVGNDPPVALLSVPPEGTRLSPVVIQSKAYSTDGDKIVTHKFQMKYDANNNGFEDDAWQTLQEGASDSYTLQKPARVGKYLFREEACEIGNICANTDDQAENERTLIIHNLEPMADVKTSSPVNEPDTRTPLLMSNLYNNGTVVSLDTGATSDKSGWVLQGGELRTKSYKLDFGMFNTNVGAPDKYFGEDYVNRTLFAGLQNAPTYRLVGAYDKNTIFFADEKYVYSVARGATDTDAVLVAYDKAMNVRWQKSFSMTFYHTIYALTNTEMMTSAMVKDGRIYLMVRSTQSPTLPSGQAEPFTYVFDRENGAMVAGPLNIGSRMPAAVNTPWILQNNLYADSKGIIHMSNSSRRNQVDYKCETALCRVSYDFGTNETYYGGVMQYSSNEILPRYISQKGTSVYFTGSESYVRDPILFDPNQVQIGMLEYPYNRGTSQNKPSIQFRLIGVDDAGNFYSSFHNKSDKVSIAIHDKTGKLLKTYEVPDALVLSEPVYYSGTTNIGYYERYLNPRNLYTVDGKGNIWTANSTKAYVLKPTGEVATVYDFTNKSYNTQKVAAIFVGSDGLINYFSFFKDDMTTGAKTGKMETVAIDPNTYSVVRSSISDSLILDPGATSIGFVDSNYEGSMWPMNIIPIGNQAFLMQGFTKGTQTANKSNVYLIQASGALTYPTAYDIGTPSKDLWLGANVDGALAFQGDLTPSISSPESAAKAAAGYVYRAQDKSNYYSAEFEGGQLRVKKTVNGAVTTVFAKPFTLFPGQTYTVRFVPEEGGFGVYVNRLKQTAITETTWTSGRYGIISRGQPGVAFANALTEAAGKKIGNISGVVLIDEPIAYDVIMNDPENDPRVPEVEGWTYIHDPNVFLQSLGTWGDNGKLVKSPVTVFHLPGEYTFKFRTKDDPNPDYRYPSMVFDEYRKDSNEVTGKIRVHRRPVAVPGVTVGADQKLTYTDESYDPDRYIPSTGQYSTENTGIDYAATRGVIERRWRYRAFDSTVYTDGQPQRLVSGKYVIELDVTDEYGAHSGWVAMNVEVKGVTALPPKAGFTAIPGITYRGVPVTIDSTASDPQDGGRENLEHAYYIRNVSTGGAESLQSDVRTSWDKLFSSLGVFNIRQLVTNSYGLTDEANNTVTIVNRKPVAQVTVPASADSANPTPYETLRPTFEWTYRDADEDKQKQWQLRIYKYGGTTPAADTGVRGGADLAWTPTADLADQTKYYIQVRVFDGYDWSDWSANKYFLISTNKPPTGDFAWLPGLVYEGDTVTLKPTVDDPDRDRLSVSFKVTSPSGAVSNYSYNWDYPYPTTGPVIKMEEPGSWPVVMTVSDGKAPAVTVSKSVRVRPLGISGQVLHTGAWEENRLRYNEKHPGAERPPNWFWAGEAFVLEALVTDTGESATKAVQVVADAGGGLRKKLSAANPPAVSEWTGTLDSEAAGRELVTLPEGDYTFAFTVVYSNGVVKTAAATIRIQDTVDHYVQVHRIQ